MYQGIPRVVYTRLYQGGVYQVIPRVVYMPGTYHGVYAGYPTMVYMPCTPPWVHHRPSSAVHAALLHGVTGTG